MIAMFECFLILLGSFALLFRPAVPEPAVDPALDGRLIRAAEPADKVYVVEAGNLSADEMSAAICLQGLVNRERAQLYIVLDRMHRNYLEEIAKRGITLVKTDESGAPWTFRSLLELFGDRITDRGFVLYQKSDFAEGLNTACNYATLEGWLAVPETLQDEALSCGLVLKKDLTREKLNERWLRRFFDANRDRFNPSAIVHVKTAMTGLRDLAIQQGWYIMYSDQSLSGNLYLDHVLKKTGEGAYILGWCEREDPFVRYASRRGCPVVASDHCRDNSFLSAYAFETPAQTGQGAHLTADPTKHYAALVYSDGDNAQWIQNGFGAYYEKRARCDDFPITWTFPPIQEQLSPVSASLVRGAAGANNCFIAGVSGSGYINPSIFRVRSLDRFTTDTAAMMRRSGLDIVSILDETPSALREKVFGQTLEYFARFDNIKGGVAMLHPDRYAGGKGRVWFSLDKPFVSVRLSLWYPEGEGAYVPPDWIEAQAEAVNAYPADPTSIDGYSVINVHPWTISTENLAYFVSLLDEHIQLVTADQLIDLISENVPHVNAAPAS